MTGRYRVLYSMPLPSVAPTCSSLLWVYTLIDRVGRKTLLVIGSVGYIISLALVLYWLLYRAQDRALLMTLSLAFYGIMR